MTNNNDTHNHNNKDKDVHGTTIISNEEESSQSITEHLSDLRIRLIYSFIIIIIGSLLSGFFIEDIFNIIRKPISPYLSHLNGGLIFTGPTQKFVSYIKVAILSGIIVTCPLWLYQIWKFVSPGLYVQEKKLAAFFILLGSFLFLLGISFTYFIVYPIAFDFLMNFGGSIDKPMISIAEYISFFMTTTLVLGVVFELPLLLTILARIGIIDDKFLSKKRRYAVVILAVLSAVITPPDIISMCLMMIPLILLYEISIIMTRFFSKKNRK